MVEKVFLTKSGEKYGPPEEIISVSLSKTTNGEELVYITLHTYEEGFDHSSTKDIMQMPPFLLTDLTRAIGALREGKSTVSVFNETTL